MLTNSNLNSSSNIKNIYEKKIDFNSEWPKVIDGLNKILNAIEIGKGISQNEWIYHYNNIFNLAISQHEEKIFIGISELFKLFSKNQVKKILEKKEEEHLFKEFFRIFQEYTKTSLSISRIARYLQRYWIPANFGKYVNNIEVKEIYPLALEMWKKYCFELVKDKIINFALNLIYEERLGNKQDKSLIRHLIQFFVEYEKINVHEAQEYYRKEFETKYIDHLKEFYIKYSSEFLNNNNFSSYLKMTEERINREKENLEYFGQYFFLSESKVNEAMNEVLTENYIDYIKNDFERILIEDRKEDMKRIYYLISRVENYLPDIANIFQNFLVKVGSNIIEDQRVKDLKEAINNSVNFVKNLIIFYDKYINIISTYFSNNNLFKTGLDKAFREIMNQNSGKFNISKLLNFYLDSILKGKEKDIVNEDEIDEKLQIIVNLFTYLEDKDEFFEHFRKSLCKRLLNKGKQYNENAEKSFLSKLKIQSGDAAIRKLQGMFTDVQEESLNEIKNKFEIFNHSDKIESVELEVQILNESYWPISGNQKFPLYLSSPLLQCQKKFQAFYNKITEKRRLQWLYNYGNVILSAIFTNSKTPVQLSLTPLQASILFLFNQTKKLSFEEILVQLWPTQQKISVSSPNINNNKLFVQDTFLEEILCFAIQPLVYYKYSVLKKENDSDLSNKETIYKNDIFILRDKIPVSKVPRKIQFPTGSAKQQLKETFEAHENVLKQREFEIEAAMVRIMKTKNRLEWNQLQVEVINSLKNRFIPDTRTLKKRLESLIDRQFMERAENDPKIIIYIS